MNEERTQKWFEIGYRAIGSVYPPAAREWFNDKETSTSGHNIRVNIGKTGGAITPPSGLGAVKLSHKELQRLTPAERAEYARYRSKHNGDQG